MYGISDIGERIYEKFLQSELNSDIFLINIYAMETNSIFTIENITNKFLSVKSIIINVIKMSYNFLFELKVLCPS